MRRNNCGIECTSDLARGRRPIIIAADISHRADPAATAAAAIWHLHGVNWYLERYYAITIRARVCMYMNATRRRANCAIDKIANAVSSHDVGSPPFWPRCSANADNLTFGARWWEYIVYSSNVVYFYSIQKLLTLLKYFVDTFPSI